MHIMYRYNLLYIYDTETLDSKGLFYPRALMHLLTGLYLAEICLVGLFALQSAFGQMLLMVVFLIFTFLVDISLNEAVKPLLYNLPRTLALESDELDSGDADIDKTEAETNGETSQGGAAADYYDMEEQFVDEEPTEDTNITERGIEGAKGFMGSIARWGKTALKSAIKAEAEESGLSLWLARLKTWATPDPNKEPNFIVRWLHPEIFDDFRALRKLVDQSPPDEEEEVEYARRGYWPPEMWTPIPKLWIPHDEARVSRQEVVHTGEVIPITDQGAWLDEQGNMMVDLNETPFKVERAW